MSIETRVRNTIKKYHLIKKTDKVLVAASGGKDSTAALYILKKLGYDPEAITIDASIGKYSETNLNNLRQFCRQHNITLHEFSFRKEFGSSLCYMHSRLEGQGIKMQQCAICGILKRYLINKQARELKADKLVTGHNLDDEAQSVLMNLLKNDLDLLPRLGPKTGIVSDKKFIPRIKPLYFITEKEITDYSKKHKFKVNYQHCPCSANVYRRFVSNELDKIEKSFPDVKRNIINNFLKILPKLKADYKRQPLRYCKRCSEPSKKDCCNACLLIERIKYAR